MTEQCQSDAPHEAWDAADRKDAALKLAAISSYMEQMENFDDAAFLRRLAHSFAVFTPPPSARDALMQAANVIHDRAVLRHGWDKHADAAVIHALAEQMPASAPSSDRAVAWLVEAIAGPSRWRSVMWPNEKKAIDEYAASPGHKVTPLYAARLPAAMPSCERAVEKIDRALAELADRYHGTVENYYCHGLWKAREIVASTAATLPAAVREETGPRDVTRQQDLAARLHAHADEVRKNKVWAPHVADELDEAARLLVATSSASVREESGAIRETCARICDGRRAGREPSDPRYLEATTCAKLIRDDYTFNRLAAAPSPNEEQG